MKQILGRFLVLALLLGASTGIASAKPDRIEVYPFGHILNFGRALQRPFCSSPLAVEGIYRRISEVFAYEPLLFEHLMRRPYVNDGLGLRPDQRIWQRTPLIARIMNDRGICGRSWKKVILLDVVKYLSSPGNPGWFTAIVHVAGVVETSPGQYRIDGGGYIGLHSVLLNDPETGSQEARIRQQAYEQLGDDHAPKNRP